MQRDCYLHLDALRALSSAGSIIKATSIAAKARHTRLTAGISKRLGFIGVLEGGRSEPPGHRLPDPSQSQEKERSARLQLRGLGWSSGNRVSSTKIVLFEGPRTIAGELRRLEFLDRIDGGVQDQDGPAGRAYTWRLDKSLRHTATLRAFSARDDNTDVDLRIPNQVRHATHSGDFGSDRFWIDLNARWPSSVAPQLAMN